MEAIVSHPDSKIEQHRYSTYFPTILLSENYGEDGIYSSTMVCGVSTHSSRLALGFRPDRSCLDNLVILSCKVQRGFINNSPTISAFPDIMEGI